MKNRKNIYFIIALVILIAVIVIITIKNNDLKSNNDTPSEAKSIMDVLKEKYPDKEYKKLIGIEFLDENTLFSEYSFINNNSIYIFNPSKLDNNEFEYKKVYDEITMYVMAGRLINENHKYGDVEQVPGMKQFGVEIEVNNRVDEAMEQMRDNINIMSRANQYSKQK